MEIRVTRFGESHGKPTFTDIVGGLDEAVANCGGDEILNCALVFQIDSSNQTVDGFHEDDRITGVLKRGPRHERNILDQADHTQHRCRIDVIAKCFVVEAHVAASDWRAEKGARLAQAVNDFTELPHNLRMLRVSEIQTIRCSYRAPACTYDVAACFRDRQLRSFPRMPCHSIS